MDGFPGLAGEGGGLRGGAIPMISEVDGNPARWRRCPRCGERQPGVRIDPLLEKTLCDRCWAAIDPAKHGHPDGCIER